VDKRVEKAASMITGRHPRRLSRWKMRWDLWNAAANNASTEMAMWGSWFLNGRALDIICQTFFRFCGGKSIGGVRRGINFKIDLRWQNLSDS
jgi:hypothetical protein